MKATMVVVIVSREMRQASFAAKGSKICYTTVEKAGFSEQHEGVPRLPDTRGS
jgi:hypothetical protein